MAWHAHLSLDYAREGARTVLRHRHDGPLRILQSLYPEGDAVCHNVLVHPPGGLVGGDTLDVHCHVGPGAHGLVTSPGATRFYRSEAGRATQQVQGHVQSGGRLEWMPLEAIAYRGCDAENRLVFALEPEAELMAWDVTALGLPAAGQPFDRGTFRQHLEIPGVWLEKGRIDATDTRLLQSPLGLAGQCAMGSLVLASGSAMASERTERVLDAARECIEASPLRLLAGATSPHPQVVVVRALAPLVEPLMQLLQAVRAAWRVEAWHLGAEPSRLWSV